MALEALTTYFTARNQKAPPKAADVSLEQAGADSARANLNNWPMIQSLLTRANAFNQQQNNALLNQAVPGYDKWAGQMGENAQAYAAGRLSDEQASNLTRLAAERGFSTGRSGQSGRFSLLRDLGINQYQSGQMSQSIMQGLIGMSKVNPMSPMAFMVTPQDALGVAESNRSAQQAWLNAEQASKNVRSNAFWAGLAAGDATFQQMSGYGQGSGDAMGGSGGGGGGWGSMMSMFGGKGGGGSAAGVSGGPSGDAGGWSSAAANAGSIGS